jgi:hypothetical protein
MRDDAANANESARVSKDEDGLVRPHASRRRAIARRTTRVNALKARLLSMRAEEGRLLFTGSCHRRRVRGVTVEDKVAPFDDLVAEMTSPIRPAEKRICRGYRAGESYDSDCRTLSSRPTVNISASLCSYQSRSQSVA